MHLPHSGANISCSGTCCQSQMRACRSRMETVSSGCHLTSVSRKAYSSTRSPVILAAAASLEKKRATACSKSEADLGAYGNKRHCQVASRETKLDVLRFPGHARPKVKANRGYLSKTLITLPIAEMLNALRMYVFAKLFVYV